MSKKEITYIGLVKVMLDKARKEADAAGADFDQKSAFKSAAARWKKVKDGSDSEFAPGKAAPGTRKKKTKKSKKSAKKSDKEEEEDEDEEPLPGHKGAPSKTRPGHIDYRTHKGDKYYNRDGHRQTFNEDGVEGEPYSHYTRHPKSAKDVLKIMDKCLEEGVSLQQCRDRVAAAMKKSKSQKKSKGKKRGTRKAKGKKRGKK